MYLISLIMYLFILILINSGVLFFMSIYFMLYNMIYFIEWEILSLNSSSIIMVFMFDWMCLLFMSFIFFISSMVILFSKKYMGLEKFFNRFIILMVMFILSMMLLIMSPNMISIILGWDGLGLISYCLVIFFQNIKGFNAGMLTALSNRVGDFFLLIVISWMLNYGSWNLKFFLEIMKIDYSMSMVMIMLSIAVLTKSAQIPFSSWLPAAMVAPTPISALVHSSTLVTAGLYLYIRFSVFFENFLFNFILLFLSTLTMLISGVSASMEVDLKKIIAFSTLSQLGLMMGVLSLGFYKLGFFHLLIHSLFKSLMFLCIGGMIQNMQNFQDMRWLNSYLFQMPLILLCLNISLFSLSGMPFLAGYYSKDLFMEFIMFKEIFFFFFFFFFFSIGLTICYMFRLMYMLIFMSLSCMSLILSENNFFIMKSMILLSVISIMSGSILMWLMFPFPMFIFLPFFMKFFVFIFCLLGMSVSYLLFKMKMFYDFKYYLSMFLFKGGVMELLFLLLIFNFSLNNISLKLIIFFLKSFNIGWNEMILSFNLYNIFMKFSMKYQIIQNNHLNIFFLSYFWWGFMLIFLINFFN